MSLFEKIAFLDSFFKLFQLKKRVDFKSENEIDDMINNITNQLNHYQKVNAKKQIDKMPLFYN
jgi:hypothetical protein